MGLIRIAESLHCHIPSVQSSARAWLAGDSAAREAGEEHLIRLVRDQAEAGADYLDVNVDNFLTDSAIGREGALRVLDHVFDLIVRHGKGVPPCIDSSDPTILDWGIRRYHEKDGLGEHPPLVNSVAVSRLETLDLRRGYRFSVVGKLLEKVGGTAGFTEVAGPETYHDTARFIFDRARGAGFAPDEIYFDPTVGPLGADMVGYTRRTFEGIRSIREDSGMSGVHICVGLSNCSDGLPRRLAINRAYLRVAVEFGLDAAICDVTKVTGKDLVPAEVLKLIRRVVTSDPTETLSILVDFVQGERGKKG